MAEDPDRSPAPRWPLRADRARWPGPAIVVWEYLMRCWRGYFVSSLAQAVGTPLLYLLALGVGLGSLIDSGPDPQSLGGVSYLDYIAPALLVAAALQVGVGESSYPGLQPVQVDQGVLGGDGHPGHPAAGLRRRGAVHRAPGCWPARRCTTWCCWRSAPPAGRPGC